MNDLSVENRTLKLELDAALKILDADDDLFLVIRKSMHGFMIRFLKMLEERIPPPPHCHHAIKFARYGSDETDWSDRLLLEVNDGNKIIPLFLDESDLLKDVGALVDDCVAAMRQKAQA